MSCRIIYRIVAILALVGAIVASQTAQLSGEPKNSPARSAPAPDTRPHPWGLAPNAPEPVEPPTRSLNAEEANQALVRDWLFQADNRPTAARVGQEIGWARQLADRLSQQPGCPDLSRQKAELDTLHNQWSDLRHAKIQAAGLS